MDKRIEPPEIKKEDLDKIGDQNTDLDGRVDPTISYLDIEIDEKDFTITDSGC